MSDIKFDLRRGKYTDNCMNEELEKIKATDYKYFPVQPVTIKHKCSKDICDGYTRLISALYR